MIFVILEASSLLLGKSWDDDDDVVDGARAESGEEKESRENVDRVSLSDRSAFYMLNLGLLFRTDNAFWREKNTSWYLFMPWTRA